MLTAHNEPIYCETQAINGATRSLPIVNGATLILVSNHFRARIYRLHPIRIHCYGHTQPFAAKSSVFYISQPPFFVNEIRVLNNISSQRICQDPPIVFLQEWEYSRKSPHY